jgi:hypothetical protein
MVMPKRTNVGAGKYRYGVNGQEQEDEVFEGATSAEYWMYDARTGRRFENDPISYAWQSVYACFDNSPIALADQDGLFGDPPVLKDVLVKKTVVRKTVEKTVQQTGKSFGELITESIEKQLTETATSFFTRGALTVGFVLLPANLDNAGGKFGYNEVQFQMVYNPNIQRYGRSQQEACYFEINQIKQRVESGQGTYIDHVIYNSRFGKPGQSPFKTQSHHVIPVALFTDVSGSKLVALAMKDPGFEQWARFSEMNRISLSTEYHGNHPAYSDYVKEWITNLENAFPNADPATAAKLLKAMAGQLKGKILARMSENPGKRLNELFKSSGSSKSNNQGSKSRSGKSRYNLKKPGTGKSVKVKK